MRTRTSISAMIAVVLVSLGIVMSGCGKKMTPEAMSRISLGMTYKQVVSEIGRPCFTDEYLDARKAWRTPDKSKGLFLEFDSEDKVGGIVHFDSNRMTIFQGSRFGHNGPIDDPSYGSKLADLLK